MTGCVCHEGSVCGPACDTKHHAGCSVERINREIERTRGRVLGEAVWRRLAEIGGWDPKDPRLSDARSQLVTAIGVSLRVMDEAGFDGLEDWLSMEATYDGRDECSTTERSEGGTDG